MRSAEEHEEFTALTEEHRDRVYRQMLQMCGNREDAEDVLTDALLTAFRRLETLEERAAFGAWLSKIARRLCFRLRSQQRIMRELSLEGLQTEEGWEPSADDPSPEERLLQQDLRQRVQEAVQQLSPELREVYQQRDVEGREGKAVAEDLKITEAAMKSRLHRARQQVRRQMDQLLVTPEAKKEAQA